MNQHEEFKDKPVIDPVTGQTMQSVLPTQTSEVTEEPRRRSNWPIVIILLAGLVLALIAWLPAELSRDTATTPLPATTDQPAGQSTTDTTSRTTPPADTTTTPQQGTQTPETQGSTPGSTPGTTPGMTQPAQ